MRGRSLFQKMAAAPHIVWAVMFIVAPMLFVIYFAFTDESGNFSFSNISSLSRYSNVFILSIAFALIATVVCLIIGYPLAYFMAKARPKMQKILMVLIMLPMWCNLLIRTYALMALLDNGGLLNTLLENLGLDKLYIVGSDFGVILGMVYDFLPYMVLPIFTTMTKLDQRYIEAAADLGCNPIKTMIKVIMPLPFRALSRVLRWFSCPRSAPSISRRSSAEEPLSLSEIRSRGSSSPGRLTSVRLSRSL